MLSYLHRVPLVFDFQGSLTSEMLDHNFIRRDSLFFGPLKWLERRINEMADVIITSSHNAAEILIQDFGCPPEKVFPLPDCVNTDRFLPRWVWDTEAIEKLKRRLGIPLDHKVVVYLGLLAEYQGSSHLLQAAAQVVRDIPKIHFLIMGFPGQSRYRSLAQELGISDHVTFTGRIPYQDAPLYLALGDIAVSPKLSETEGNGKLLNYMAVGLPTVTFDTSVSHEILGDLGMYADTGDIASLARTMAVALTRPDGEELGHKLREKVVAERSWDEAGEKLVQLYAKLCS